MAVGRVPVPAAAQDVRQPNPQICPVPVAQEAFMAVTELFIADEIRSRLPEKILMEVAAHLYKRECQTCGKPLGGQAPALTVDDAGPFLSAMLNHQACRPSGWYQLRSVGAGARLSWTSRFFTLPVDEGTRGPRATFMAARPWRRSPWTRTAEAGR